MDWIYYITCGCFKQQNKHTIMDKFSDRRGAKLLLGKKLYCIAPVTISENEIKLINNVGDLAAYIDVNNNKMKIA